MGIITDKMVKGYKGLQMPKELIQGVEDHIKVSPLGYKSKSEFVKAAIREKLERERGDSNNTKGTTQEP